MLVRYGPFDPTTRHFFHFRIFEIRIMQEREIEPWIKKFREVMKFREPSDKHDDPDLRPYYELGEELGHGGMGAVFLARLQPLGVLRALKVLRLDEQATLPEIDAAKIRFLREARIMGNLRHPAVVKALDYQAVYREQNGESKQSIKRAPRPSYFIYAMEPCLVEKDELPRICTGFQVPYTDALEREREERHGSLSLQSFLDTGCRFPERTAARFARELISVLRSAHEQTFRIEDEPINGVVHRDVKPSNILVGPDGRLMLTDFGISKTTSVPTDENNGSHSSSAGGERTMTKGTPYYAAPEQWSPDGAPVSREADYYGLGVVLYQVLTGCPQEELGKATTSDWKAPSTRVQGISNHWDILLRGMLIRYPDMRLADPALLDYEFAEIEEGSV